MATLFNILRDAGFKVQNAKNDRGIIVSLSSRRVTRSEIVDVVDIPYEVMTNVIVEGGQHGGIFIATAKVK